MTTTSPHIDLSSVNNSIQPRDRNALARVGLSDGVGGDAPKSATQPTGRGH
jgi:hypothetical protein